MLGEEAYAGLRSFFVDSWRYGDTQPRYRVYFAQKARNINEIFFQIEYEALSRSDPNQAARLKAVREETFTSQTGMFLQAPSLAAEYKATGRFPRIMLIDELARSGSDYAEFFYTLERHITGALTDLEWQPTEENARRLHTALTEAIDFRTYLCNKAGLLVEDALRRRVNAVRHGDLTQIYALATDITNAVTASQLVENTDFMPTLYVSEETYRKAVSGLSGDPRWIRRIWNYRNEESAIWYQRIPLRGEIRLYYAVRARALPLRSEYALTAYVFWGNAGRGVFTDLIGYLGECFRRRGSYKAFCGVLDRQPSFYEVQADFVSSILSLLVELSFLRDAGCADERWTHDLEKTCQSFGFARAGSPEDKTAADPGALIDNFRALADDPALCEELLTAARIRLSGRSERPLCRFDHERDDITSDRYQWRAENFFIEIELQQNASVSTRRQELIPYVDWSKFGNVVDCSLEQYLNSFPEDYTSFEKKIGALLVLYQHGLIGYKKSVAVLDDDKEYAFLLNAGEAAEILIYQHMYRFMPALIYLERTCRRNGLSSVSLAGWFGRELERDGGEPGLGKLFSDYLSRLHKYGYTLDEVHSRGILSPPKPDRDREIRTVREWDGKPWPAQEAAAVAPMSWLEYRKWERDQEDFYLGKVKDFFGRFKA